MSKQPTCDDDPDDDEGFVNISDDDIVDVADDDDAFVHEQMRIVRQLAEAEGLEGGALGDRMDEILGQRMLEGGLAFMAKFVEWHLAKTLPGDVTVKDVKDYFESCDLLAKKGRRA
jgi:hypothetical protein